MAREGFGTVNVALAPALALTLAHGTGAWHLVLAVALILAPRT